MTHTDLIARLRDKDKPLMQQGGFSSIRLVIREAADALTAAQERIEALEAAIRPFAKSGELFPEEPGTVEFDICVYRPAKGREWGLCGDDLRRARAALAGKGEA